MLSAFKQLNFKKSKCYGRHVHNYQDGSSDEFYTRRDTVEQILNYIEDDIKGKKIYCPCDGPQSKFVQVLQERGYDVRYTWDDYMKHDDLWQWADVIITNPPFSKPTQWLIRMSSFNKPVYFLHNYWIRLIVNNNNNKRLNKLGPHITLLEFKYKKKSALYRIEFDRPDGTTKDAAVSLYKYTP